MIDSCWAGTWNRSSPAQSRLHSLWLQVMSTAPIFIVYFIQWDELETCCPPLYTFCHCSTLFFLSVSHSITSTTGALMMVSCLTVSQRVATVELRYLLVKTTSVVHCIQPLASVGVTINNSTQFHSNNFMMLCVIPLSNFIQASDWILHPFWQCENKAPQLQVCDQQLSFTFMAPSTRNVFVFLHFIVHHINFTVCQIWLHLVSLRETHVCASCDNVRKFCQHWWRGPCEVLIMPFTWTRPVLPKGPMCRN